MAIRRKARRKSSSNKSRYNEIAAIIIFAVALLTLLSLVTSNPADPSVVTSSSQGIKNWVGFVGANIAAVLFNAIGSIAYLSPFLLMLIAFKCFKSRSLYVPFGRFLGFILFILSGAGLTTLLFSDESIAGKLASGSFSYLIGTIGAGILLLAFFLVSLLLITNISFASFFESVKMSWENFQVHLGNRFSKFKKWQDAGRKDAKTRAEKRDKIRKDKSKSESPTISMGNSVLAKAKEKAAGEKDLISGKVSAVIKRLGEAPDDQKAVVAGDIVAKPEIEKFGQELKTKAAAVSAKSGATAKAKDLVSEGTQIPIAPIQKTGELDGKLLSSESDEESKSSPPPDYSNYKLPKVEFLTKPEAQIEYEREELEAIARLIKEGAGEFNVKGEVPKINLGPVVTTYEFKPDPGVKYSRVTGLVDDLCLTLEAESLRIERVPGKAVVGIEVPNKQRETIYLRDIIDSDRFKKSESALSIALGKRIDGHRHVTDLTKMPHLLIAGATGAGKSVGVNSIVVSILYKAKPDDVKFIMIDPKRLELGLYADIPHLATPIITDPKRAAISLKWAVSEMERRYKVLAGWGVRNIDGFNKAVKRKKSLGNVDEEGNPHAKLPFIVIIVDELADLMMTSGKEVEESITRLAQMARAVGIHLVLATQRPSVDVITGLIKANFPSRIAFRVSSKIDSRTIIDSNGAERLLGRGDMLFLPPGTSHLIRVHGAYVDEKEIKKIVDHIKNQAKPEYDEMITKSEEEMDDSGDLPGRQDKLFGDALKTVVGAKRASTSLLQRHLRIGYGRAAAILDALVADGFIGEMDGSKRARPVTDKAYEAVQEMEEGREF